MKCEWYQEQLWVHRGFFPQECLQKAPAMVLTNHILCEKKKLPLTLTVSYQQLLDQRKFISTYQATCKKFGYISKKKKNQSMFNHVIVAFLFFYMSK